MTIQVPRQSVLANSQLSYAGDWVKATVMLTTTAPMATPLDVHQAGWRVRVTYAQGDQPNNNSGNQLVGIGTVSFSAASISAMRRTATTRTSTTAVPVIRWATATCTWAPCLMAKAMVSVTRTPTATAPTKTVR
ncbi:MAG: hypothetical protein IPP28_02440 [Xanthomonadales bacterium]|nr:hypothetical protein [Xanthomonadales bacterium]